MIVQPKMKMWCLSAYPQGHPRSRWLCPICHLLSRTQTNIFNSNHCSLSNVSHKMALNGFQMFQSFESLKKTNVPEHVDTSRAWCCEWAQDSWTLCIIGKTLHKYCSVSCTDRSFRVYKDLNVSPRATGFNLVLSVYYFLDSKLWNVWNPLTAIIWLTDCNSLSKNLCLCSTEETKSPTSGIPGKQINIKFSFLGELSL